MSISTIATLTTVSDALKTVYVGALNKQIDEGAGPTYQALNKFKKVPGNDFKFAMQYGRSGGVGARSEDGTLPTPDPRYHKQATASVKNLYGRIALTEKLILTSQSNTDAFVNQLNDQMESLKMDMIDMVRRNICNKSDGVIAKVSTVTAASYLITITDGNIKAFYPGQVIDIIDSDTTTITRNVTAARIVDVDYSSNAITLKSDTLGLASVAANDLITLAGNYGQEMTGLLQILDTDNTIYGIDRSANKWYNPRKYTSSASSFDSMYMQQAIDDIYDFTGKKPDMIIMNAKTRRAFVVEQNTYKRNVDFTEVKGGFKLVSYDGLPISVEKYFADGNIAVIRTDDYYMGGLLKDFDWMDSDGSILHRLEDQAAYEATLFRYCELVCTNPNAQALITGLTV